MASSEGRIIPGPPVPRTPVSRGLQNRADHSRRSRTSGPAPRPATGRGQNARIRLLPEEVRRQAKVVGARGEGRAALGLGGLAADGVWVVSAVDAAELTSRVLELMSGHRDWKRFDTTV